MKGKAIWREASKDEKRRFAIDIHHAGVDEIIERKFMYQEEGEYDIRDGVPLLEVEEMEFDGKKHVSFDIHVKYDDDLEQYIKELEHEYSYGFSDIKRCSYPAGTYTAPEWRKMVLETISKEPKYMHPEIPRGWKYIRGTWNGLESTMDTSGKYITIMREKDNSECDALKKQTLKDKERGGFWTNSFLLSIDESCTLHSVRGARTDRKHGHKNLYVNAFSYYHSIGLAKFFEPGESEMQSEGQMILMKAFLVYTGAITLDEINSKDIKINPWTERLEVACISQSPKASELKRKEIESLEDDYSSRRGVFENIFAADSRYVEYEQRIN